MIVIPEGWRRLSDTEPKQVGDSFLRHGTEWVTLTQLEPGDMQQRDVCKPYIRPLDDAWHDHDEGEMPVHGDTRIDLEYECDGHVYRATVLARQCLHLWRFNPNEAGGIKYLRYRRHQHVESSESAQQEQSVPQVAEEAYSVSVTSLVTICKNNLEQLRVCSQADGYIAIVDVASGLSVRVPLGAVSCLIEALEVCRERSVSAK